MIENFLADPIFITLLIIIVIFIAIKLTKRKFRKNILRYEKIKERFRDD